MILHQLSLIELAALSAFSLTTNTHQSAPRIAPIKKLPELRLVHIHFQIEKMDFRGMKIVSPDQTLRLTGPAGWIKVSVHPENFYDLYLIDAKGRTRGLNYYGPSTKKVIFSRLNSAKALVQSSLLTPRDYRERIKFQRALDKPVYLRELNAIIRSFSSNGEITTGKSSDLAAALAIKISKSIEAPQF